ncbi:putative bacterial lipid A biosynthesis acyltransferase [Haemophilus haemolyticus M19107]|nr:putative bacterial lipid A biosynthesis acyltransferase [Haemophilus haemolyticus M19107]
MKNEKLPQFQPHFLAPKYWLFWLGVAIWRSILCLPYPIFAPYW